MASILEKRAVFYEDSQIDVFVRGRGDEESAE